jgi:Ca2+/H+ antiporter, TMEM165/GDT1 family
LISLVVCIRFHLVDFGGHPDSSKIGIMDALLLSFGVIFIAELGDKSQLMALAFAARYKALDVLIGIAAASALLFGISVVIGRLVAVSLPTNAINIAAGVAFLAFAAWTIRGEGSEEHGHAPDRPKARFPIISVGLAIFLAELGDKTMLATVTLATTEEWLGTWVGSTTGMIAADAIAIVVGRHLGTRLPERAIKVGAALLFVVFGVWLLIEGIRG